MKNPPKWVNVYPQGTKQGDEEQKFFIAIARHPKYDWRSVSAISKETGMTKERIEEIIEKYYKKNMIFQNPKNEDQWGYRERNKGMLKTKKTISNTDKSDRIDKSLGKSVKYIDSNGNPWGRRDLKTP